MSRETTLARAAARHAASAWRTHRADCPRCARPANAIGRCKYGDPLYLAHESARKELARNVELDKQPPAGQDALF